MVAGADTTAVTTRWMAVGHSAATDSYGAGQEAARKAMEGGEPRLLLVFAGIGHDPHRLAEGIRAAAPGVPVIGCSTHGEINEGGPHDGTVVVTALGGTGFSVATSSVSEIS